MNSHIYIYTYMCVCVDCSMIFKTVLSDFKIERVLLVQLKKKKNQQIYAMLKMSRSSRKLSKPVLYNVVEHARRC